MPNVRFVNWFGGPHRYGRVGGTHTRMSCVCEGLNRTQFFACRRTLSQKTRMMPPSPPPPSPPRGPQTINRARYEIANDHPTTTVRGKPLTDDDDHDDDSMVNVSVSLSSQKLHHYFRAKRVGESGVCQQTSIAITKSPFGALD